VGSYLVGNGECAQLRGSDGRVTTGKGESLERDLPLVGVELVSLVRTGVLDDDARDQTPGGLYQERHESRVHCGTPSIPGEAHLHLIEYV